MAPGYVGMVGQSESGRVMQPKMQSFNEWTSAAEVARAYGTEVSGKTIIITGVGPDGLGVALCEAVAPHNPGLLILAGRDLGRVRTVAEAVSAKHPDLRTAVVRVDLASRESVRQAADEIGRLCDRVHVLVNNAGVMCIPHRTVTGDGTEMHLAVNYVGPFLLTRLIGKQLAAADPGRVVNVSSSSHTVSPFRFSDAQFDTPPATLPLREQPIPEACRHFGIPCTAGYAPLVAYGQSKTAGILHAKAIAGGAMGSRILAYSVNPGGKTNYLYMSSSMLTTGYSHCD